jgi:uncharacterized protein YtpQ (UPF0354 family)
MRNLLTCLTLIICICSCNNGNKILSQKEFTKLYADSLQKRYAGVAFTIKKDLEISSTKNENEYSHYLNNAYDEYAILPDSLNSVVGRYLTSIADLYKDILPVRRNKIMPVIKDVGYLDEIASTIKQSQPDSKGFDMYHVPYNDKLLIMFAEDNENSIAYISEERLKEAGINKDSMLAIALANLDAIVPAIERHGDNGLYMITAGGNYEASLILLKEIWNRESMPVDGDFVVSIPTRDLLLVTGSNNKIGIEKIKKMANDAVESNSYHLIADLFVWNGNKFVAYK